MHYFRQEGLLFYIISCVSADLFLVGWLGQVTSLSRRGTPSPDSNPVSGVTFIQGDATDPVVLKRIIKDGAWVKTDGTLLFLSVQQG